MWMLVKRVYPKVILGGYALALLVGLVGIGLRVGLLPQHWWLGQRIFLTITAIPSLSFFIHLSIHSASQAKRKASHYQSVQPTNPHSAPLASSLHPYIRLTAVENPTPSQLNKTEIKHPPESYSM